MIARTLTCSVAAACVAVSSAWAQAAPAPPGPPSCLPRGFFAGPAAYRSVEQLPDGRVTFRLCAPEAASAMVTSTDNAAAIPFGMGGAPPGLAMVKDSTGLWSVTTAVPVEPGTYRYNFRVGGARVPDPQATRFSEERVGINSVFEAVGPEGAFQSYDPAIPHGVVSEIEYWSTTLDARRRAHVYTPPGYMKGADHYPVLYLVHGAGDSDDSWTSVGRAHYILDNLIAAGRARPMIVVMPFGHTPDRPGTDLLANRDFGDDLLRDLIPHVEAHFRTLSGPANRAMAGLSMGGAHTLRFGLTHPEVFSDIGIFSMGLLNAEQAASYQTQNEAALRRAARDLRLVYYAMGTDDFLYNSVAPTRAILDRFGIRHLYNETGGGHTWTNWRHYLTDFAPRLFR